MKAQFHITDRGRAVPAQNPPTIDKAFLSQFEEFEAWRERAASGSSTAAEDVNAGQRAVQAVDDGVTPEDAMAAADKVLRAALSDELLSLMMDMSPQRFEQVILDLLAAMGFGKGALSSGHTTKACGDGGVHGVIHEDALDLDAVYVQAQRYAADNKVSRPDIQRFVGSLVQHGVGFRVRATYAIETVDKDYFSWMLERQNDGRY